MRGHLTGALTALLAAAGCTGPGSPATAASPTVVAEESPTRCISGDVSVDFGPYVIAGMTEQGTLPWYPLQSDAPDAAVAATIVVAEVIGFEPGIFDTPDGGMPAGWGSGPGAGTILTPVRIHVERVIRGEVRPGALQVVIEGGTAGCSSLRVDVAPRLDVGRRYVLFLYPSRTTDGQVHPDRLRLNRDAWRIDEGNVVSGPNGPMSLADLVAAIERVTSSPQP